MEFLYPELSYKIRGACFTVYKSLGSLHKESVYQKALADEFSTQQVNFQSQVTLPVKFNGKNVGIYRADFVIDNKIIIELKATKMNIKQFEQQLFHYLSQNPFELAFLVNFGVQPHVYIKRWVVSK